MSGQEPPDLYYRRLEVAPAASHEEIARAYRRLALGVHPDAHPEDPQATRRFREITEAYEVLADPVRRDDYDRKRRSGHVPVRFISVSTPRSSPVQPVDEAGPDRPRMRPTYLGRPRFESLGSIPLRVGPVHIDASSPDRHEAPPPAGQAGMTSAGDLLLRILNSWWGR